MVSRMNLGQCCILCREQCSTMVIGTWWKMRTLDTIAMINQNVGFFGLNVLNIFKEGDLVERYLNQFDHFNIKSTVDKVFPYQDVGEAHEYIEQRKSKGKVLLKW